MTDPAAGACPSRKHSVLRGALRWLASLKLTVVLFALAIFLVFAGTLAQADKGLWHVMAQYFRTPIAWIEPYVFFSLVPRWLSIPFPGGWLIGGLLVANLIAGHAVRFKLSWRGSGMWLTHSGLVVILLGELVTGLLAVESTMSIDEGESANYAEQSRAFELAAIDRSDQERDWVTAVPQRYVQAGRTIRHEDLPFDMQVDQYLPNSQLVDRTSTPHAIANAATAGAGLRWIASSVDEVSGTSDRINVPSVYVTFRGKSGGEPLGTYLVSLWFAPGIAGMDLPQRIAVDGKAYDVYLRFRRIYKPYTVHLVDFRHDRYTGTNIPRNFSSLVRLDDPSRGEQREFNIYMNHPLRHAGETFYQYQFKTGDKGTVLQVVNNPGWLMPYIATAMVTLGLMVHFGISLVRYAWRST